MAERRMFAKTIVDSDAFLDMPVSSQNLYFHLAMRADDDGFINSPKKIARIVNASDDDLKLLIAKNFIIPFETGVVVIKHWRLHNYLRNDRYKPTVYQEEKRLLNVKDNGVYTFGIPTGNQLDTQGSIGKGSIVEEREEQPCTTSVSKNPKQSYDGFENVLLTDKEYQSLINDYGKPNTLKLLNTLDAYKQSKGKTYKSDMGAIRSWVLDKVKPEKRHIAACPRCGATPFAVICRDCDFTQGDAI